jgi:hypothetical protein
MRSNTYRFVRGLALAIAVSALAVPVASVAPAAASVHEPSSATPQTAQRSDDSSVVLRRDGSQAVPFVADVAPQATATSDGFDWGDAGIGATAMLVLAGIAAGAGLVLGRRPSRRHTSRSATPILGGRG